MALYTEVFDAFKAKILTDDWDGWSEAQQAIDLTALMESAIPYFKFPKVSLARDGVQFTDTAFGTEEIQILATYMKVEWLERTINSWENVKAQYDEKDFSQANFLDKLIKLLEVTRKKADKLQSNYYRSISGAPFDYGRLAGNGS